MNFILLAAGALSEKILKNEKISECLRDNLVGAVVSNEVRDLLPNNKEICVETIFGKKETEEKLLKIIKQTSPRYILSIQYPWILSKEVIEKMRGRILNLHNAKLPEYRGHNSLSHEILNNETYHTTSLHWIDAEVDRGRLVNSTTIPINLTDTAFDLWKKSSKSAEELIRAWFVGLKDEQTLPAGKSIACGGQYYSKDLEPYKCVPVNASPSDIDRWARAFHFPPHEPAYIEYGGNRVYLLHTNWQYSKMKEISE